MANFTLQFRNIELVNATKQGYDQTYRVDFVIRADAATDTVAATQYAVLNLPWTLTDYGAPYAVLTTFDLEPEGELTKPKVFYGTATYVQNGSITRPKISFRQNTYDRVVWEALNEDGEKVPVLNSAGDRFVDPLMDSDRRLVIVVERMYIGASAAPSDLASYMNTVNLNPITIADVPIPARGGLMLNVQPEIIVTDGSDYNWRVTFEIEVRGNGETYDREVLDQGLYYLEEMPSTYSPESGSSDNTGIIKKGGRYYRRVRATTKNIDTGEYEPTTKPILLDGDGGKLEDVTPGQEVYLTFQTKTAKDWSALGLPVHIWETV